MKNRISFLFVLLSVVFLISSCGNEKPQPKQKKVVKVERKKTPQKEETASTEEETPSEPTPPEHIEKAKEIIASVDADLVAAVNAKTKFKTFCAICHGFKGDLKVNGAKNLRKSKISLEESVAQIYFGKGLMTPFKGILKDKEIVAVAKYVETLRD